MFGDMANIFKMLEGFAHDLFSASLPAAEAEAQEPAAAAKAARARVTKLKKSNAAIDKLIATQRRESAAAEKRAKVFRAQMEKRSKKIRHVHAANGH